MSRGKSMGAVCGLAASAGFVAVPWQSRMFCTLNGAVGGQVQPMTW